MVFRAIIEHTAAYAEIKAGLLHQFSEFSSKHVTYIILPAYQEREIVTDTMHHFLAMLNDDEQARIIIVTQHEEATATTGDTVAAWLADHPDNRFIHLIDDAPKGGKSSKLNAAITMLQREQAHSTKTRAIVGVYDFDARPLHGTLTAVAEKFDREPVSVVQQVPFPFGRGLDQLSAPALLMALGHGERALRIEMIHHARLRRAPQMLRDLRICMGAGLFIDLELIISVGGFPLPWDDIPLGYRLDLLNVNRARIRQPALVEPAPRLLDSFRGTLRIYDAVFGSFAEVRRARNGWARIEGYVRAGLTHLRDIEVPARSWVVAGSLALAFGTHSGPLLAVSALLFMLNWLPFMLTVRTCNAIRRSAGEDAIVLSAIAWILGPFFWSTARGAFLMTYVISCFFPAVSRRALGAKTPRLAT